MDTHHFRHDAESDAGFLDDGASERKRTIARLERLAQLLDSAYRVPGVPVRFGLDALIGLLPGIGDVASAALSTYLVYEARRLGVPRAVLMRMIGNVAVDTVFGAIPLLGDAFDVVWRTNIRNLRLLRRYLDEAERQA